MGMMLVKDFLREIEKRPKTEIYKELGVDRTTIPKKLRSLGYTFDRTLATYVYKGEGEAPDHVDLMEGVRNRQAAYKVSNGRHEDEDTKIPRNQETKKSWNQDNKITRNQEIMEPRKQETKKPRNHDTKKTRNQEDKVNRKRVSMDIEEMIYMELKIASVRTGTDMYKIVEDALKAYLNMK